MLKTRMKMMKKWIMMARKVVSFFYPIDLVVNAQLAIRAKLQNGPLDGVDINHHCGRGGSSDVEETVLQILESSIGQVFSQFHWPRHPSCGVSVYLLEEY